MSPRKVCVVITARPSYARIKSALRALVEREDVELQLVVAASALLERYGSAVDYIAADGFSIDARVYMIVEGENPVTSAKSTGLGLVELATVLDNLRPDIVVTIADRFETLATAAAAAYTNIPLAHVQGGEVSGSIDEKVRHAVTKLADIHLVSNDRARDNVVRMGEDPGSVFVTGGPDIDLAAEILEHPPLGACPIASYGGVGPDLDLTGGYAVVLQHPVTNEYEQARAQVVETLHAMHAAGIPTLWFWPNVDAGSDGTSKGIRMFREQERPPTIHFFRNMPPEEFLRMVYESSVIVGNSSVAIRECGFLGVPAVNIGCRQAGREHSRNVVHVGHDRNEILAAVRSQIEGGHVEGEHTYGDGKSGPRIAEVLATCPLRIEKRLWY